MTNTKELRTFLAWLRNTEVDLADQEESDLDELVLEYLSETDQDEEVPTVRQTTCSICQLDVEVALDDIALSTRDRGGNARCPGGTAHDPLLDPEDWDAHEYHVGDVAH